LLEILTIWLDIACVALDLRMRERYTPQTHMAAGLKVSAERVSEAICEYNRYRGAKARAELLSFDGARAVVKFKGPFCYTCGVLDWVEDLKYLMESMGLRAEVEEVVEPRDPQEAWRVAVFRLVSP